MVALVYPEALPRQVHGDNVPQIESHGDTHNDAASDPIPDLQNARLRLTADEAALVAETAARIAADSAEAIARAAADATEAAARIAADGAEATARAAADASEATTRGLADSALSTRVTALEALRLFRNYKAAGQQLTSNTTAFQNITFMRMPGLANEAWRFTMTLIYLSTVTADFKFQFTVPAGATLFFSTLSVVQGGVQVFIGSDGAATPFTADGTGGNVSIEIEGTILFGATPGDLQLQAAQNVAAVETTDFVVQASNLVGTQVA